MKYSQRFVLTLIILFTIYHIGSSQVVQTSLFASGLTRPIGITNCGDERLFVIEQRGIVKIVNLNGTVNSTPFLDIQSIVNDGTNEQGLLGIAFDPNYDHNGYFYLNYSKNVSGNTIISRFSVDPNDPNVAIPSSEVQLLEIPQPFWNHNGGNLAFGKDGYLYVGMGDGGSGGDPQGNGQNLNALLAKMLRIDVSTGQALAPTDNPFYNNANANNLIWAYGLRNPWRWDFDNITQDLWIADVGQNAWEEIDFQPSTSTGGENYGWNCYEGTHTYSSTGCTSTYTAPVFEYAHSGGNCSVTGGVVYRGAKYAGLWGHFLFTDLCSGIWWSSKKNEDGTFSSQQVANYAGSSFVSFGEDINGEIYASTINGSIYKISETSNCAPTAYILTPNLSICPADTAKLIAIGDTSIGITYQWYKNDVAITNAIDNELTTNEEGIYKVVVTRGQCTSESSEVNVSIVAPPSSPLLISPSKNSSCVNGDIISLHTEPTGGVISGNGILNNEFFPELAGVGTHNITYSYVDNLSLCTFTKDTSIIVFDLPIVTFDDNNTITFCKDSETYFFTATPVGGNLSGNGILNNGFTPSANIIGEQVITYTYVDEHLCSNFDTLRVLVDDCVAINELKEFSTLVVSPNPNSGEFDVIFDMNEVENITFELRNELGQIVQSIQNYSPTIGKNQIKFKRSSTTLQRGNYYLMAKTSKNYLTKKIIIY
ncbi:MAG: PQQ-dependent sugar dehydrogenase [Saprospiraceae bacterium]|nr:PQQ-dependent sugar dehydrogenase [Saprospiraceae bacterium]